MANTLDITPYFNISILEESPNWPIYLLVQAAKRRISRAFSNVQWQKSEVDYQPVYTRFVTCFFSEAHPPSWGKSTALVDRVNHYFTLSISNGYVVVHSSSNDVRDRIIDALTDPTIAGLSRVSRPALNAAFLFESDVRTLWMRGIHRRTGTKPDTKTLTGENLRFVLNPLSDQSYSYNSARARLQIGRLDKVFGVNLTDASIWMHHLRSWGEFLATAQIATSLVREAEPHPNDSPISVLPHPVNELDSIKGAYDFQVAELESIAQPTEGQITRLNDISANLHYEVAEPASRDNAVRLSIHDYKSGLKFFIGMLEATPVRRRGRLKFDLDYSRAEPDCRGRLRDAALLLFRDPSLLQIWYESGHCISASECYKLSYADIPFRSFEWGFFKGFNIEKEKPLDPSGNVDLSLVGSAGDDSLFSWVLAALRRGNPRTSLAHLSLNTPKEWLMCDDGSGEAADFIHANLGLDRPVVTFIHVKAAKTSSPARKLSVTAHDVVLSQATKNVYLLDDSSLLDQLDMRLHNGAAKTTWNGQTRTTARDFSDALSSAANGKAFQFHVVVVQPHTRRSYYRKASGPHVQRKQLDTLLISTQYAIRGFGCELSVVGSADL